MSGDRHARQAVANVTTMNPIAAPSVIVRRPACRFNAVTSNPRNNIAMAATPPKQIPRKRAIAARSRGVVERIMFTVEARDAGDRRAPR